MFADFPLIRLAPEHVKVLRDRRKAFPQAENIRIKVLRGLFKWAIENNGKGGVTRNPARDVPKLKVEGDTRGPNRSENNSCSDILWELKPDLHTHSSSTPVSGDQM